MKSEAEILVKSYPKMGALITGGTSGIGLEVAAQLAEAGVPRIVLNGRNEERGGIAREELLRRAPGIEVSFLAADAGIASEATYLVTASTERLGTLDLIVNCVGGDYLPQLFQQIPLDMIEPTLKHYLMAPLYCCRLALPLMAAQGGGVMINIASDAAKIPTPGETVIGAAMSGICMFTRTLAIEAKRSGVRVNAVTPSIVSGTRTSERLMQDEFSAKIFRKAISAAHLGVATSSDIASLVVFIAGPQSARITGQVISVNGGISTG